MAEKKYPITLHHPHTAGVVKTIENAEQEKAWIAQGWLTQAPKASTTKPVGERVTTTK